MKKGMFPSHNVYKFKFEFIKSQITTFSALIDIYAEIKQGPDS